MTQDPKVIPHPLHSFVSGDAIRYGDPNSFSGLTLVPVYTDRPAPFRYTLLAPAVEAGTVSIQEAGSGHVPILRVTNRGDVPVLLIDGEHLVGVRQNRILNTTLLVPENSTVDVPVSCVEAGRWGAPMGDAKPTSACLNLAARELKSRKVTASIRGTGEYASDQSEIWDGINEIMRKLKASSATRAISEGYERRAAEIGEFLKHLPSQPGQTGVVAAVGGRVSCADLFDGPETLAGIWERLIPSYAVEVLASGQQAGERQPSAGEAKAFLCSALEAAATVHPAVGRGTEVRLTGERVVGSALMVNGSVIHLALFARERAGGRAWRGR